jgi:hypothetical protein
MLGMVALIPTGFGVLLWNAYRKHKTGGFEPEGKLRWDPKD